MMFVAGLLIGIALTNIYHAFFQPLKFRGEKWSQ
jgi:hypothetical protein